MSTAPLANWFDGRAKLHQAYVLMENMNLWPSLRVLESAKLSFVEHDPNVEVERCCFLFLVFLHTFFQMLVDAVWSMYLTYQVRNELEPDANLRPALREMRRMLGPFFSFCFFGL